MVDRADQIIQFGRVPYFGMLPDAASPHYGVRDQGSAVPELVQSRLAIDILPRSNDQQLSLIHSASSCLRSEYFNAKSLARAIDSLYLRLDAVPSLYNDHEMRFVTMELVKYCTSESFSLFILAQTLKRKKSLSIKYFSPYSNLPLPGAGLK